MILKSLGAILLSVLLGGLIGAFIASLPFEIFKGGGGGFLPNPEFDVVIILINGFLHAISGFMTAVITLALIRHGHFTQLNVRQVLILTVVFGLINSLIFAALQYNNAVGGRRSPVLDEFAKKIILETAIIEFVTGSLIGLISVIVVKFFNQPSD